MIGYSFDLEEDLRGDLFMGEKGMEAAAAEADADNHRIEFAGINDLRLIGFAVWAEHYFLM